MTDFYWIGGAGPWDNASTANWSLSSGGAAGAGPPTVADNAIFDSNSGAGTVSVAATGTALAVTINLSTLTVQLAGNATFAGLVTLTAGTLDMNGFVMTAFNFASSNSNVRVLAFGTGHIDLTGNAVNLWDTTTTTNMTVTGTPVVNCTYAGSAPTRVIITGTPSEANAISFNVTAGTDNVQLSNRYKNLDLTGFSGTLNVASRGIYGNLTLSTGMTVTGGTSVTSFISTDAATRTITTNGKTIDLPLTFNGIGGSWEFADALTQGSTRAFTLTNGTVKLKSGVTSTVGSFTTTTTTRKYLMSTTGGTRATLSDASGTNTVNNLTIQDIAATGGAVWDASAPSNMDAGNNSGWLMPAWASAQGASGVAGFLQVGGVRPFTEIGRI